MVDMTMKTVRLGDVVNIYNGSTPSTSDSENFNGNIQWITPKDLSSLKGIFVFNGERTISEKGFKCIGSKLLPKGTILLSSRAPIGLIAIAGTDLTTNQGFKNLVCDAKKIDNIYLYYLLKLKINEIQNLGSGTTFKEVSKSVLEDFNIQTHKNLKTQQSIAKILSQLDQKIALNNQINAQLEQMAKTLYEYWFVQFDFPDDNGKPYKSSGGAMIYNEQLKREIPKGWGVKSLKEIANTGSGGTPKSDNVEYYKNGNIAWINSGELNESIIIDSKNFITRLGMENSSAKLFPKDTILLAMYGATAGKSALLTFQATTNQAICAIIPKDKRYLIYLKIYLDKLQEYLVNLSSGSARDNLSQDKIKELNILVPNDYIIDVFYKNIITTFEKIILNKKQNQQLTQLRDFLLPMLMNGQVGVSDE